MKYKAYKSNTMAAVRVNTVNRKRQEIIKFGQETGIWLLPTQYQLLNDTFPCWISKTEEGH